MRRTSTGCTAKCSICVASPECASWLGYGLQPKNAERGLTPGRCSSKAHDRENLGLGGRRFQVSRAWSGKTLSEHRADRATVVREVIEEAGIEAPDADWMAAEEWFAGIEDLVEHGHRSPSTLGPYRHVLDRHVLPGL